MTDQLSFSTYRTITLPLIRKRSEHNEGLVSNLEEIALHQEELEAIGPILGRICGKTLRILLLQNNVISKMNPADLKQLKVLEYLNLALNNIQVVEGIEHFEHLNKLDLTLNFIDVDTLEESVEHMKQLSSLRELYMVGNPCCGEADNDSDLEIENVQYRKSGWKGFRMFVVANLPQLSSLDGKEITRSERIKAIQKLPKLTSQLHALAESCREYKLQSQQGIGSPDVIPAVTENGEPLTAHTPEVRSQISNEMALQKVEKGERERANQPRRRGEWEFEQEQNEAIKRARERELHGDIKQCNEGKWKFGFDEVKKPGFILLDISLPKFLSSSLIDVDIHPTYISVVIKSKILRLVLPAEVKSETSSAQRSTTTGHLLITMPKVNPYENILGLKLTSQPHVQKKPDNAKNNSPKVGFNTVPDLPKGSVKINEIIPNENSRNDHSRIGLTEVSCKKFAPNSKDECDSEEDDEPPPIF